MCVCVFVRERERERECLTDKGRRMKYIKVERQDSEKERDGGEEETEREIV